jgi:hypothetical protein
MKKTLKAIIISGYILLASSSATHAQKVVTRVVKASTVDINRGTNPHIKSEAPTIDTAESKSKKTCKVQFTNYTGYFVTIYVDGYYRGQLSPQGGGSVVVKNGYTSIYCITAGKTLEWFDAGNCIGLYTFKLYP